MSVENIFWHGQNPHLSLSSYSLSVLHPFSTLATTNTTHASYHTSFISWFVYFPSLANNYNHIYHTFSWNTFYFCPSSYFTNLKMILLLFRWRKQSFFSSKKSNQKTFTFLPCHSCLSKGRSELSFKPHIFSIFSIFLSCLDEKYTLVVNMDILYNNIKTLSSTRLNFQTMIIIIIVIFCIIFQWNGDFLHQKVLLLFIFTVVGRMKYVLNKGSTQ